MLPASPLLLATLLWLLLGVLASILPSQLELWWQAGALLAIVAAVDAAYSWWEAPPQARRKVATTLPLGVACPVEILLNWNGSSPRAALVTDHTPDGFECQGLPARVKLDSKGESFLHYRLRALQRGEHRFAHIQLRVRSRAGLWWKQIRIAQDESIKVYPNFSVYSRHALQAANVATMQNGMLKRRRRGEGMDFEQLREYREGDAPRQIDWKATARMSKLISREYQDERDQRIILLADCGRRMGARDGELSHFDHALDSLLLLAYVGLRHGDAVGLMTMGGTRRMLAPQKSAAMLARILHTVYDLQPTLEATDFELAAQELVSREKKRALVVVLTNLRDEDDKSLLAAIKLLRRHHLVLVASLREKALDEACQERVHNTASAAFRDAAIEYRARRDKNFSLLRQTGALCIDVAPHELAVATVNRYLAIKAAGVL